MTPVIKSFTGPYQFLSNFYAHPMKVTVLGDTLVFPTSEHLFQALKWRAMKYDNEKSVAYVRRIVSGADPASAKRRGGQVEIDVAHWEKIKHSAMRQTLLEKFSDPELQEKLIDTDYAMLVEGNTWGDTYWGRVDGRGYNVLGSLLMEVRGYFIHRLEGE